MSGKQQADVNEQFQLFEELVDLDPIKQKQRLVSQKQHNPELCRTVQELLAIHLAPPESDFLEIERPLTKKERISRAAELHQGDIIGNYKILQLIGKGGMGQVYMAEQKQGVHRRVALKIIHAHHNTKNFAARFDAERQALSRLDHPNIARILDSNRTDSDRRFIVMELVRGESIIQYCDREKLAINERLKLMQQVCRAVHHAHQKGIIHRDIKPSNILITLQDGLPTPKVIDFGIAKAIDEPLVAETLFTNFGDIIGTPSYMSPEQLENGGTALDIRSDIYSLGVVLHELLTGQLPFEPKPEQTLVQRLDILRNSDAVRPSLRVTQAISSSVETVEEIAAKRRINSGTLLKYLSGDLDWVLLKALARIRGERYDSSAAFANDLQCFLNQEPVQAVAPSLTYKAKKVFQKYRAVCLATGITAFALVASTFFSTYWALASQHANERLEKQGLELLGQIEKSQQMEKRAITAEKKALLLARQRQNEAALSRAISSYLAESLMNPSAGLAALTVTSKYLPEGVQFTSGPSISTATVMIDVNNLSAESPLSIEDLLAAKQSDASNPITLDQLPAALKDTIRSKMSMRILESASTGNLAGLDSGQHDQQEVLLLQKIKEQQIVEFGSNDEFVGQTLLKIAKVHIRAKEPIKAQLAIHEALKLLKDIQMLAECETLLKDLKR